MCWACSKNMSEKQVLERLDFILKFKNEEFELFNTTSVYFLFYCSLGMFGQNVIEPGLNILKHFINFVYTKPSFYLPKNGLEPMFHPLLIEKIYWWIFENKKKYDKINEIYEFIINKLEENQNNLENKEIEIEEEKEETEENIILEQNENIQLDNKILKSNSTVSDSSTDSTNDFVKIDTNEISENTTHVNDNNDINNTNNQSEQFEIQDEILPNTEEIVEKDIDEVEDEEVVDEVENHLIIELLSIKVREFDEELCAKNIKYKFEKYWNVSNSKIYNLYSIDIYIIIFFLGLICGFNINIIKIIVDIFFNKR